jgi:hypothetical protein
MAPISFAQDIRPLFTEEDIAQMRDIANFDMSSYEDVRAHAADIYERVADGTIPCTDTWSKEQVARFKQWMDEGRQV